MSRYLHESERVLLTHSSEMATKKRTRAEWADAFGKYGGSARFLLAYKEERANSEIDLAIENCDKVSWLTGVTVTRQSNKFGNRLVEVNPVVNEKGEIIRGSRQTRVISPYIFGRLLAKKLDDVTTFLERDFRKSLYDDWQGIYAGHLFELIAHAHTRELASRDPIPIRRLGSNEVEQLDLRHISQTKWFEGQHPPELSQASINMYYRPKSPTVPGIDSFAFTRTQEDASGVVLFQYTISRTHAIKATFINNLWEVVKAWKPILCDKPWSFVFVIPKDRHTNPFPHDMIFSSLKGAKIKQYLLEASIDDIWESARSHIQEITGRIGEG